MKELKIVENVVGVNNNIYYFILSMIKDFYENPIWILGSRLWCHK